jgi:hypothetical protein
LYYYLLPLPFEEDPEDDFDFEDDDLEEDPEDLLSDLPDELLPWEAEVLAGEELLEGALFALSEPELRLFDVEGLAETCDLEGAFPLF